MTRDNLVVRRIFRGPGWSEAVTKDWLPMNGGLLFEVYVQKQTVRFWPCPPSGCLDVSVQQGLKLVDTFQE